MITFPKSRRNKFNFNIDFYLTDSIKLHLLVFNIKINKT